MYAWLGMVSVIACREDSSGLVGDVGGDERDEEREDDGGEIDEGEMHGAHRITAVRTECELINSMRAIDWANGLESPRGELHAPDPHGGREIGTLRKAPLAVVGVRGSAEIEIAAPAQGTSSKYFLISIAISF